MTTVYDVTTWSVPGNPPATPYNDIGLIINSIIADIKSQQTSQASKSGAVIYAPGSDLPQTRPPFRTLNSSRPTGSVGSWVLPPRLRTTPLAVSSSARQLVSYTPGIGKGTRQTVQLGHHQRTAGSACRHRFTESRANPVRSRQSVIDEDLLLFNTKGKESVSLAG